MQRLSDDAPPRYIALHKPYMTLCSLEDDSDKKDRSTLRALDLPPGMLNVGRLDRDSEGLLLLTRETHDECEHNKSRGQAPGHARRAFIGALMH